MCVCPYCPFFNFYQNTPLVLPYWQEQTWKNIFLAFLWIAFLWLCLSWLCLSWLGLSWHWILSRDYAHDLISENIEQSSLEWLGYEVPDHISGWTPYQWHIALWNPIGDKEIPNVYVFSALSDQSLSIILQKNRAPFFLKQNVVQDYVSLSLQRYRFQ